ncbi:MAG: SIS domain-containing protein [Actinomycetota bacterium]|jgi:glucosamine--fructose-6-phosphate aminotransferase (isomerizing)|nr:SIS domain-containing protein [Actinomycetota bacterium]
MMRGHAMHQEMHEQPSVLARIADHAGVVRAEVSATVPSRLDGAVLVGRGSSDNAAVLGRYLIELAARRPAGLAAPSLHTRYDATVDFRGYLAIALSQSGNTEEVVETCESMRAAGARVIGITNSDTSRLATSCDLLLLTGAGEEAAIPATKTVTAEMALLLVVASAIGDRRLGAEALGAVPAAVSEILEEVEGPRALAASWATHDRCLVSARGILYAAALETALKIKETSRVLAEGISIADLRHGPIAAVDATLPVLGMDGGPPFAIDNRDLLATVASLGAPVASCAPRKEAALAMPGGLPEALYAILATVRGQQLAYELSLARDLDPDQPPGLTKVTQA